MAEEGQTRSLAGYSSRILWRSVLHRAVLAEDELPVTALASRRCLLQVRISLVIAGLEAAVDANARHVRMAGIFHVCINGRRV